MTNKQIIIKDQIKELLNNPEDVTVLSFVKNNKRKFILLGDILQSGFANEAQALLRAGITKSTFSRIKRLHEKTLEYCEENDIDIEKTEFADLHVIRQSLEISKGLASERIFSECYQQIGDKYYKDDDGNERMLRRGATIPDMLKLLKTINNDYQDERPGTAIQINNENSQNNFEKVNFSIVSSDVAKERSEDSQNSIIDATYTVADDIERQIEEGIFNEK